MRLLALAILVLGACSTDSRPTPPTKQPPPTATPDGAWTLQARFPGPTKTKVAPVATPVGMLEQHTEMLEDKDGAFVVQWADYPAAYVASTSREAIYDQATQGAAKAVGGTIQASRPVELSGFGGREVVVDDGRGHAYQSRFFLVDRRLYLAGVATSPARLSEPMVRAFLESLRLVKTAR